jgi:isoquinoline 1-oxidoreductase alpha subunit
MQHKRKAYFMTMPPNGWSLRIFDFAWNETRGKSDSTSEVIDPAGSMALQAGPLMRRRSMTALSINGKAYEVDVEADTPLLWVLRDTIGLTGTKYGCGIAQCGACTVHIDGVATRSCSVQVGDAAGREITTIEGLAVSGKLHKVQQAWLDFDVPQCGYCQSGMIMAVAALLKRKHKPSDAEIDAAITNICRCGTYQRVRAATHAAASYE